MTSNLYKLRVKEIMSKHLITIGARDTVHEAMELLIENKVHALPVVDNHNRCVGMLSTSDFVDIAYELDEGLDVVDHVSEVWWGSFLKTLGNDVGHRNVSELMTEDVVSATPETLVVDAAASMLRDKVHRLPVLDEKQRLLGIVSTSDILRAVVEARS